MTVSAMLPLAKQCAFEEPSVETISGENVLTWPHVVSFHSYHLLLLALIALFVFLTIYELFTVNLAERSFSDLPF